jgi:hypothetical protein
MVVTIAERVVCFCACHEAGRDAQFEVQKPRGLMYRTCMPQVEEGFRFVSFRFASLDNDDVKVDTQEGEDRPRDVPEPEPKPVWLLGVLVRCRCVCLCPRSPA